MNHRTLFFLASSAAFTALASQACSHAVTVGPDPAPSAAAPTEQALALGEGAAPDARSQAKSGGPRSAGGADPVLEEGKHDEEPCGAGCDDAPGGGGDPDQGAAAPVVSDKIESVPIDGAPSRGPAGAPITIVSFGDYECPFTARGEEILRAIDAGHPREVRFVFKSLALPMHAHARLAAIAALAADAQGRFGDFHDRVFSRGATALDREGLTQIAIAAGLDAARFSRDLDDPALAARVARDQADAAALNVKGTPTFFVNGRRVAGAQSLATFEAAIAR